MKPICNGHYKKGFVIKQNQRAEKDVNFVNKVCIIHK